MVVNKLFHHNYQKVFNCHQLLAYTNLQYMWDEMSIQILNFFCSMKEEEGGGVGVGGVLFRKFSNFEIVNVRKVMTRVECFKTFSKHVYRDCVYLISTAQKTYREYKKN